MNTNSASLRLTPSQRDRILVAVYRELFLTCPAREGELRTVEGAALIETHLDALVDIVRRSTAESVEPYLAQIHEDVCSKCPYQTVSGYCAQRLSGPCAVYRFAAPIVRGMRRALEEMGDEAYLGARSAG